MTVLGQSLPADPRPGSNLKGRAAGAAWTYLLPRLDLGVVLCVGDPSSAALETLRRMAPRLVIAGGSGRGHRGPGVEVLAAGDLGSVADGSVDLVYVTGPARLRDVHVASALRRKLRHDGHLYVEAGLTGPSDRRLGELLAAGGLAEIRRFWLTPATGEARSAVPAEYGDVRDLFAQRGIAVPSWPRLARRLERRFPLPRSGRRMGLLATSSAAFSSEPGEVPKYLRAMAAADDVDLAGYRYGLSARGRYNSRKILFYLFPPGGDTPTMIVKTTRDSAFNARLENEARALRHVAERNLVAPGSAPEVVFAGHHGGLAMVAETALKGIPLSSRRIGGSASGSYEWLTSLAERSSTRDSAAGPEIVAALEGMVAAVMRIYGLDRDERQTLDAAVHAVAARADDMPIVFAHGDAGVWNRLVLAGGRVAFLDWEAAEPRGLPLWDLFYFARSHVLGLARLRQWARRPKALVRELRFDGDLRRAVRAYGRRLQLSEELVESLFVLCWAHRALREVPRLDARRLSAGHYVGLLRASLAPTERPW